ncbi:hypothetical protein ACE102_47560 (plasmid) [Bradyrhizobium sp. vgs-9]|jgi:hypothetical protein|uniref:hypothetical protein n=1 Tax=Bradyrhizobium sp. vgs-9 TaxID=208389 RepID=UPI0035D4C65C
MNAQRFGDAVEKIDCRFFRLPLKTGQVGTVYPGLVSQFLLRDTAIHADPTHVPGHKRANSHAPERAIRPAVKPLAITALLHAQQHYCGGGHLGVCFVERVLQLRWSSTNHSPQQNFTIAGEGFCLFLIRPISTLYESRGHIIRGYTLIGAARRP